MLNVGEVSQDRRNLQLPAGLAHHGKVIPRTRKRSNPRKAKGTAPKHLTPRQKSAARDRARRAGRCYPNLVDNMREVAKTPGKTRAKKKAGKASRNR